MCFIAFEGKAKLFSKMFVAATVMKSSLYNKLNSAETMTNKTFAHGNITHTYK